jgi:hypothetical protein
MATLIFRPRNHVFSPKSGEVRGYHSLDVEGLASVMSSRHFRVVDAAPESVRIEHLFSGSPGGFVSAGSDEVVLVPAGSELTLRAGDKYRVLSAWDRLFVEFHIEEKSGESAKSPDDQSTQEIHVVEKSGESAKSPDDQSTQEIHVVEKVKKDKNGYEPDDDFVVDDNIDDEDKRVLCYGVVALVSDELKKRKVFKEHLLKEAVKPKVKQESSGNIKEMRSITLNRRLRQKAASFCGAKLDKLVSGSHEIMMREMKLLAVRKLIVEMGQTMQGLCASFSMLSGSLVVTCLDQVVATLDTVLDELRQIAKDKDEDKDKDAKDKDEAEKDEAEKLKDEAEKLKFFAKVDERIVEFEKIANPEDEEKKKAASTGGKAPKKRRIVPTVTGK